MFNKSYKLAASLTIRGALQSKANSRRLVTNRKTKRPMFIKSEGAAAFVEAAAWQVKCLNELITADISLTVHAYYPSRRNDLDISLLKDVLQGKVYANDRQVKEEHAYWHLDQANPRVFVEVYIIGLQ